jgi:hypothetical protein
MLLRALSYFFTKANRNVKTPLAYLNHKLTIKLNGLRWGTTCQFPAVLKRDAMFEAEQKEALEQIERLSWPANDVEESASEDEADADATIGTLEATLDAIQSTLIRGQSSKRKAPGPAAGVSSSSRSMASPTNIITATVRKSKRRKQATSGHKPESSEESTADQRTAPSASDLRAPRSRVGRVIKPRDFLSFNHHDEKSASYLFYSNV